MESKVGMVRRKLFVPRPSVWSLENFNAGLPDRCLELATMYFVKLICTVSSLFLDSFVVHSGRFGLSGFLLVLFGYFISEWVFL